jgi:hypothetical protein
MFREVYELIELMPQLRYIIELILNHKEEIINLMLSPNLFCYKKPSVRGTARLQKFITQKRTTLESSKTIDVTNTLAKR